jgi:hypothetical protein
MKGTRNALVWTGVIMVVVLLWFVAGRTHLHLVDETLFILWVGVAAIALSALYWWSVRTSDEPSHSNQTDKE